MTPSMIDSRAFEGLVSYSRILFISAVSTRAETCVVQAFRYVKLKPSIFENFLLRILRRFLKEESTTDPLFQDALLCVRSVTSRFPASTRRWFTDSLGKADSKWVEKAFQRHISPSLIAGEVDDAKSLADDCGDEDATGEDGDGGKSLEQLAVAQFVPPVGELRIKASAVSREVTATYSLSEVHLTIVLRLPENYPLRMVEVEAGSKTGMTDTLSRKTLLGS